MMPVRLGVAAQLLSRVFRKPAEPEIEPEIAMIMQELDDELLREHTLMEGLEGTPRDVGSLMAGFAQRCQKFAVVGSVRRGKVEPGDLDILYIPKSDLQVIEWLERIADDEAKIALHDGRWTCTVRGMQMDFIVSSARTWGMDMIIYTGSREFNERVKRFAARRGIDSRNGRLGVTRRSDGYSGYEVDMFANWSEEKILKHLGLEQYLDPRKREEAVCVSVTS